MRPLPGNDAWIGRQRPADHDALPLMTSGSNNHMSFFVADEVTVDSYLENPSLSPPRELRKASEHVLSSHKDDKDNESSTYYSRQAERDYGLAYSPVSRGSVMTRSPASMRSQSRPSLSRPMTPIMLGTSCAASATSSPSSRKNSLVGSDLSENAISFDDEGPVLQDITSLYMMDSGSAPQLIMPSINMPNRRPFTDAGKAMGRLKLLIAGDSGVGKTSLCKAIVQACEHIVHVDPIGPQVTSSRRSSKATTAGVGSSHVTNSTAIITEIFASTKPYPEWWADLGDFRGSQRRKSLGDAVLERNICFVDTPGYGTGSSAMETIVPCVEYVESHLNRVSSDNLSESDMLNMLGGDGGFQVDVVFYLIHRNLKPVDIEYLRRLTELTNVIPLLAQSDKMPAAELASSKQQVAGQLQDAGIRPFTFTASCGHDGTISAPIVPYSVSSATDSDHDVMDASLLMSPDYVEPLVSSELIFLVGQVFSLNGSSWLRHSAVKKYMQWRNTSKPTRPKSLYRPLILPGPQPSALTRTSGLLLAPPTSLALARVQAQQQETAPSHFHILDWAADLQRSLASEKAQYVELARGERALWLTEKLSDCVRDGTLVPVNGSEETNSERKRRITKHPEFRNTSYHQDPLGLLQVAAELKVKGWVALEYIGAFGLIGGLAYLIVRERWREQPAQLAGACEWATIWGMHV